MPGKRSPTVTELKEEHWHSVSALVKISESWLGFQPFRAVFAPFFSRFWPISHAAEQESDHGSAHPSAWAHAKAIRSARV